MDRICVTMPTSPREFFLAMPAVQDYIYQYVQEVARGLRDTGYQITFRMSDEFEEYEAPLKVAKEVIPQFDYTGWTVNARAEFTNFIDFDFEAAKKISLTTGKHITESLGILIGSKPRKWPILPPPRCSQGKGILVLNWDSSRLMAEAIKVQKTLGNTSAANLQEPISMNDIDILDVDTVEAVIGPASVLTHLAASYSRKVVEMFPDQESYALYNNEEIINYQAIIGKEITAEIVLQAWQALNTSDLEEYAQSFLDQT